MQTLATRLPSPARRAPAGLVPSGRLLELLTEAYVAALANGRLNENETEQAAPAAGHVTFAAKLEDRIIDTLRSHGPLRPAELCIRCHARRATLNRVLARLQDREAVGAIGSTKDRRYVLLPTVEASRAVAGN